MRRAIGNSSGIVVPPIIQASLINWTSAAYNTLGLSWMNGNGTHRLLIGLQGASTIPETKCPKNWDDFSGANANYSLAPELPNGTSPRPKILAYGNINSTTVTGLVANTRYCFRLFEVNEFGGVKMLNYRVDSNTSRSRNTPL